MKYIFLHGLGQTSSSWDKVIDNLDFKDDILCPNLSKWTKNKETCYHTLYTELENYMPLWTVIRWNISNAVCY